MGCDIHCYIEHRAKDEPWRCFGGRINPGRNYAMFCLMAGVRSYGGIPTLFEPRGCPEDLSWGAKDDNTMFITESTGEGYVSAKTAREWVRNGSSEFTDDSKTYITHPDWHSHSWLTAAELWKVFHKYSKLPDYHGSPGPEWLAIFDCLKSFELYGEQARLVFWFDN